MLRVSVGVICTEPRDLNRCDSIVFGKRFKVFSTDGSQILDCIIFGTLVCQNSNIPPFTSHIKECMFVSSKTACEQFHVSPASLRRWQAEGRMVAKILPSGHRRYLVGEASERKDAERKNIVYCRVSSPKQRQDLQRQTECLAQQYPQHRVVTDIGSGINFHRPELLSVLGRSMAGGVSEVVVASKD